ncbi:MAG: cellulase family glycosylhydrolase, partial [Candidatus Latescibacterota bacterium]
MMELICMGVMLLAMAVVLSPSPVQAKPLQLHADNPHYFDFNGKPIVLITSAEHYGAVVNLDFDYEKYLEALAKDGLNHTRMFVGAYCEPVGAFKIVQNTLAPTSERFICPWARSLEPGYKNGGNKFDLTKWDAAYFARLKDFMSKAADNGIIVEVNLFCPFYRDEMWDLSPMNAKNNVNGLGDISRDDVYTLDKHMGLLAIQDEMVRQVVFELKDFDNLFYEVMNEPYARKVPMNWQEHVVDVIVAQEKELGVRHLISLNIANKEEKVEQVHADVSILNFHYAWPPTTVAMNYALDRVIGDNETGFKGTGDYYYRREGWAFILSGGALYNNLDYTFAVGYEDGTFEHPDQPGSSTQNLRSQLGVLSQFIHRFDFVHMSPNNEVVVGNLSDGLKAFVLA